jgi:hypothetical protein
VFRQKYLTLRKILKSLEEEAKERQVESGKKYGENHPKELVEFFPQALIEEKSRDKAAKLLNSTSQNRQID